MGQLNLSFNFSLNFDSLLLYFDLFGFFDLFNLFFHDLNPGERLIQLDGLGGQEHASFLVQLLQLLDHTFVQGHRLGLGLKDIGRRLGFESFGDSGQVVDFNLVLGREFLVFAALFLGQLSNFGLDFFQV